MIKHLLTQPFVVTTALAALYHSTWALGIFFSGPIPQDTPGRVAWVIPAFLVAFSLDIGQIATAHEIKSGDKSWIKFATFFIFAVATFYLQHLYIVAHIPDIALGAGVSSMHTGLVTTVRDAAIYIIPLLLPLSTLLYTFSHRVEVVTQDQEVQRAIEVMVPDEPKPKLESGAVSKYITQDPDTKMWVVVSPTGRTLRKQYKSIRIAENALRLHLRALKRKTQLEVID